jgi:hypothetical protein
VIEKVASGKEGLAGRVRWCGSRERESDTREGRDVYADVYADRR